MTLKYATTYEMLAGRLDPDLSVKYNFANDCFSVTKDGEEVFQFTERILRPLEEEARRNLTTEYQNERRETCAFFVNFTHEFDKEKVKQECLNILVKRYMCRK